MKLQTKLLLLLTPSIVLPLLGLGWMAYAQLRDISEQQTLRQMGSLLHQVELHMASRLRYARANVELFAGSHLIQRYLLTADEEDRYDLMQPPLLRLFTSYQKAYPEYYEIRVLLPDGYEDARSTIGYIPNSTEEEAQSEYFQQLKSTDSDAYTTFLRNPDNHHFSLLVAKKIRLKDRAVDPVTAIAVLRGYLMLTISLDFLKKQANKIRIGKNGFIFFTDKRGERIFYSADKDEHKVLPKELFGELVTHAVNNQLLRTDFKGRVSFLQGKKLHENLFLFAVLPEDEVLAASRNMGMLVAAITLATILITTALLMGALRSLLLRPIQALRNATRQIGKGTLAVALNVEREDEIGELASAFDEMSRNLQRSSNQIRFIAYHDSLTGLPNRLMFIEYLSNAVAQASRYDQILAVLFLDLDDFKRVNDTLGHHAGDELLKQVTELLTHYLRQYDYFTYSGPEVAGTTLARLGGDEFIILLPNLKDPYQAGKVAARLIKTLSQPFILGDQEFNIGTSVGITTFPENGADVDSLIKNADIAMYHAKSLGKNRCQYFTAAMNVAAMERMVLEKAIRKAIEREEFVLYYQPMVDACSRRMIGAEALIRWNHPEKGLLAPAYFIELAEDTGLITPLGEWVLKQACKQNKAWQDEGFDRITVSVNVSNRQFGKHDLEVIVRQALEESALLPEYLNVELTESSVMEAEQEILRSLDALKAMGVQISMDDFGSGYSSLSALRHLPIDTLKIDRSFVSDITNEKDGDVIVATIIAMAKTLHLRVIAEGVEDETQLAFLRRQGCDLIQGYLISRPIAADQIEQFLERRVSFMVNK